MVDQAASAAILSHIVNVCTSSHHQFQAVNKGNISMRSTTGVLATTVGLSLMTQACAEPLRLDWSSNMLTIRGDHLPVREINVHYLEAYCRANSHTTNWSGHTVVGHQTQLISQSNDRSRLHLRCEVGDGITVDHVITSTHDVVEFRLDAHNSTDIPAPNSSTENAAEAGRA